MRMSHPEAQQGRNRATGVDDRRDDHENRSEGKLLKH
jgi:hypothetical protein